MVADECFRLQVDYSSSTPVKMLQNDGESSPVFPPKCENESEYPVVCTELIDLQESVREKWPNPDSKQVWDGARSIWLYVHRYLWRRDVLGLQDVKVHPKRRWAEPSITDSGGLQDSQVALMLCNLDCLVKGSVWGAPSQILPRLEQQNGRSRLLNVSALVPIYVCTEWACVRRVEKNHWMQATIPTHQTNHFCKARMRETQEENH